MTERKKDLLYIAALLTLLVLSFSKILFTDKIIRAPDIISEAYWWMKGYNDLPLSKLYSLDLKATWDIFINSGFTNEGGMSSMKFLLHLPLILHFFPAPASVAWFIVLHLFFGAVGVYCCCRLINTSRIGALFAALIFALATENASLINAGHVMKIATIAYAPWAFYCLEKGFLSKRVFWFMTTAFVLAFQFFNSHWQIAYYTCLSVGFYGLFRSAAIIIFNRKESGFSTARLLGCNLVVLIFFLSTVAISLAPLANWSKDTNRGVQSGANQGSGGLDRDEAMSWSMPPEEAAALLIPGFFGLSRQEGGPNPVHIASSYWGRLIFTQTASYMGLLPWLLLPLPLIFRRDRYTWLAVIGTAGGILFSMGKYTPFYNLLFDYFPGINRFRVPKMIMFIPVIALAITSARGLDLLLDREVRSSKPFRRYLAGLMTLPVIMLSFLGILNIGEASWLKMFSVELGSPTRYEQGPNLILQRWNNILFETGIATALTAACSWLIVFGVRLKVAIILPLLLIGLYMADVWRVNDKFMFLVDPPQREAGSRSQVMDFIARDPSLFRILPADGSDPMSYATNKIPVMFTSNAVQQRRWQELLDVFSLESPIPDLLNVKYLLYGADQYAIDGSKLSSKYRPVFRSTDTRQVVLENRSVMQKAWLVHSVIQTPPGRSVEMLKNPAFDPAKSGLVESPPPFKLAEEPHSQGVQQDRTEVKVYTGERIVVSASVASNALLILGEKYYRGWQAFLDGREVSIIPVNHILRGVYLEPGHHTIEFRFDPLPFRIGKYLTLASFALFGIMLVREWVNRKQSQNPLKHEF